MVQIVLEMRALGSSVPGRKSSAVSISIVMKSPHVEPVAAPEESRAHLPMTGNSVAEARMSRRIQCAQAAVLVALYVFPAILCLRIANVGDADLWWHLRSGEWMLQHHAVPRTDPFSSYGAGKPWAAYSWLYELLIYQLFQRLGLVGMVAYTTGMAVAVTVFLHRLMRRLQADFTFAVALTGCAAFCFSRLYTPRPWFFSVLFFVLELDLLMQARKTGKIRGMAWLPVLFALWANLHIEFIVGLVMLAIALAESIMTRWWSGREARIRPAGLCGISMACILATLANPYGWRIYQVAYDLATQSGVLSKVTELLALPFRRLDDWIVLLLALAATGVLARARRLAFFESLLLVFAIYVSFHSQRDVWVVVIAASAILASELQGDDKNRLQITALAAPFIAAGTALVMLLGFRVLGVDNARLRAKLAEELPVRAVEVVREKGWSGPLYNDYSWGGYLIWALRLPVSMDGRQNVYGDEQIDRSHATWDGRQEWASDPELQKAGVVIGPVGAPLTQLLRMDPRFELGYEDKLAAVFVARKSLTSGAAEPEAAAKGASARPLVK